MAAEIFTDKRLKKIIDLIKTSTKGTIFENRVFLVGGCIRDSLLKKPINDVDIVVEKEQGGILFSTFLAMRTKCYVCNTNPVVFHNYGTAKLEIYNDEELKGLNIECVESRRDFDFHLYGTVEEDSRLRDLTINQLYYNIGQDQVYDFSNRAVDDLRSKTLRVPGDISLVFTKDPIKMLRIIRFSTQLGWDIEKNTWLGIIKYASRIRTVAQERISTELIKILTADKPSVGIRKLLYCGMLDKLMPDVYDMTKGYESKNPLVTTFDHTMNVLDKVQPYIDNRLAALYHDIGKIVTDSDRTISPDLFSADVTEEELKRLKFPTDVIKSVSTAIRYHRFFCNYADGATPPDKKIRKFMNLCGEYLGSCVDLMNANNLCVTYGKKKTQVLLMLNRIEELEKEEENLNVKLPVNGNDIINECNVKGPMVGNLLEVIKEAYFDNPKITKEECIEIAKAHLKLVL